MIYSGIPVNILDLVAVILCHHHYGARLKPSGCLAGGRLGAEIFMFFHTSICSIWATLKLRTWASASDRLGQVHKLLEI